MKTIKSTNGFEVFVDDEDYSLLNRHSWWVNNEGYPVTTLQKRAVAMHLFIIDRPVHKQIDHKNRNKLDNRKENLRICGFSENNSNRVLPRNPHSPYSGVIKKKGVFQANIHINGQDKYIAQGLPLEELAKLRDYVAWRIRGEFAYLNFPNMDYSSFEHPRKEKIDKKIEKWLRE